MFTPEAINNFWTALSITGKGMFGIFVFMGLFYLLIKVLDRAFPKSVEELRSDSNKD
jgi:hypothetical protein